MYQSEKLKYWSLTKRDENRHENRHSEKAITANAVILCGITRTDNNVWGARGRWFESSNPDQKEKAENQ